MKKQLFTLLTCCFSLTSFSQIQQNDTTICLGDSLGLNVAPSGVFQSCTGQTTGNFSTWTAIAPIDSYSNIIKEGNTYYLRSQNNVYQASSLNGPWISMNFNTQVGNTCAAKMLGFDWTNKLYVATCHNDLYAYENGIWVAKGLSGFGCGGNFIQRLANNRILAMKAGFLRDLYISDNNGNTWTNVTNVDNDYWDMIVSSNGTVFSCGGSNTPSMTGLIKSTNNGTSFSQINSQLGISYCSGFANDCDLNVYAIGDNKIFRTTDNGTTWNIHCNIPPFFTTNPFASQLVFASNGDIYFWGTWSYSNSSQCGIFISSDNGLTWGPVSGLPINNPLNISEIKEIDGNIVVTSAEGTFAKTLTSNFFYLWSTGETTPNILVQPNVTTIYTLQTTLNSAVSYDTIVVSLANSSSAGPDQTICKGDTSVLSGTGAVSYAWNNNVINGQAFIPGATAEYIVTGTDVNGCVGTDSVVVTVNDHTFFTQTQTSLDSYTWPVNGQTYTQSGLYYDTLTNAAGCDSVITLDLTLSYTGIEQIQLNASKKLAKITDLNGKETPFKKNTVLLFVYEDGTIERIYEAE